jgi:hypothetical protein
MHLARPPKVSPITHIPIEAVQIHIEWRLYMDRRDTDTGTAKCFTRGIRTELKETGRIHSSN